MTQQKYDAIYILITTCIVIIILYLSEIKNDKQKIENLTNDITQLEYQLSKYECAIDNMQELDTASYNLFLTYLNNCE